MTEQDKMLVYFILASLDGQFNLDELELTG